MHYLYIRSKLHIIVIVYDAISYGRSSAQTTEIIGNYIKQIVNDKTDLNQFNQKEHAGLCCAGEAFIGAYLVCNYA